MAAYNEGLQFDAANKYEIPSRHIESEGDKLIKELVQKQLNAHICLETQLQQTKEFEKPAALISITSFTAGQNDLKTFKECYNYVHNLEELHFYGLTASEIELLLDYEKGEEYIITKHRNICKTVLQEHLDHIFIKINDAKVKKLSPSFNSNETISRHEKEIALCVKPNSDETKLYNFALSCSTIEKPSKSVPLDHPINQLPQLENKLFGYLGSAETVPSVKKRRKKARKYLDAIIDVQTLDAPNPHPNTESSVPNRAKCSKWDLREPSIENKVLRSNSTKEKVYTCPNRVYYTIKNKEIVKLKPSNSANVAIENIDIDNIIEERLTEDQIRNLPRFQNYERGTPSKVLYIKNLANGTTEEELIRLCNFVCSGKCENAKYRLLNGKMKGQAFVTFDSSNEATVVLEAVNGCQFKGKPIIVQFGRSPAC